MPLYAPKFEKCIIADYSIKALQQAQMNARTNKFTNISLIAANIYHLPFRENTIINSMMIRVIHHLENTDEAVAEIARIMKPSGTFILEYPNKKHIKARVRALLNGTVNELNSLEPYSVPTQKPEGATTKDRSIMLNYNPRMIENLLRAHKMSIYRQKSMSFFRIPVLKRFLPAGFMVAGESFLQQIAGKTTFTPSIVVASRKTGSKGKSSTTKPVDSPTDLTSILVCPACNGSFVEDEHVWTCTNCKLTFKESDGIYDFRYPTITE
jgi:SAM-dependent methyltransferase/ribosomal protein L37AE/L43A